MGVPKISVLMPNYNYARFLPEAIESVLSQNFRDFELVIVDNCSTDDSATVIKKYATTDPRIRFEIRPANSGMVANWNHALSLAAGEYVLLLFSDDKFAGVGSLGGFAKMLDEHPSAVMAISARTVIDEDSRPVEVWANLGEAGFRAGRVVIAKCFREGRNLIGEPSVVMLRKAAVTRGFDVSYRQLVDLEMWLRLLEHGDAVYTPEPLGCFRRHSRQESESNRGQHFGEREMLRLLEEYRNRPYLKNLRMHNRLIAQLNFLQRRDFADAETLELEKSLKKSLGPVQFVWHSAGSKLIRPTSRLQRFWRKHILRKKN